MAELYSLGLPLEEPYLWLSCIPWDAPLRSASLHLDVPSFGLCPSFPPFHSQKPKTMAFLLTSRRKVYIKLPLVKSPAMALNSKC